MLTLASLSARSLRLLMPTLLLAALAACSSTADADADDAGDGAGKKTKLACLQRTGSDGNDDDCVAMDLPRKLDCSDDATVSAALSAGCKRQDPSDDGNRHVCCAKNVTGTAPKAVQVDCTQSAGADQDAACSALAETPRKLTCGETQAETALSVGCVKAAGAAEVCCPLHVSGVAKGSGSSAGSSGSGDAGSDGG